MSRYVPVKGHSGLVRDTETNALINADKSAIQQAREKKELRRKKKQEEQELKQRVSSLETDISDIKKMLEIVVSKMD
jgi:short-subunit dehydrogenase